MALDRGELKKLLKEKGVKSLDDFNAFMREISKEVVETILDGELTDHLGYEKHDQKAKATDNARNGFTPKTVKSKFGEIGLEVPRDRKSDFDPQIVKKRQKDISGLEEKIISMYAKGMTTRDIQAHIRDLYGYEISPETVSSITDKVLDMAGLAGPAVGIRICPDLHGCRVPENEARRPCPEHGCVHDRRHKP